MSLPKLTLSAALTLLASAAALGQVPPAPTLLPARPDPVSTGPTSYGWPGATPANSPVLGGQLGAPAQVAPTPLLEATPTGLGSHPGYPPPIGGPGDRTSPLPGSTEDFYQTELEARRSFQRCSSDSTKFTMFPQTLLWEHPFAEKRAPRLSLQGLTLDNYDTDATLDNNIGGTVALFRWEPYGLDFAYQIDIFGVVLTRLSPEDLIASDYRFGIPLSFRRGDFHGKISFEHTSAHLGDEAARDIPRGFFNYAKNEVILALGYNFPQYCLRVYGQVGYAVTSDLVGDPNRFRFDAGFQYVYPGTTGLGGTPYFAGHIESRGDVKFNPILVGQVGYLFRNPYQRLANLRVYGEYWEGRSEFGQFFRDREKYLGIGIACDF